VKGKSASLALILIGLCLLTVLTGCFFRVIITSPSVVLVAPADNALGQPTTFLLTWEATPGTAQNSKKVAVSIVEFRVYMAKYDEPYGEPETITDKEIEKTGLNFHTRYKWKVVAVQSDGQKAESEERSFTTEERYEAPEITLLTPEDGELILETELILSWEATAGADSTVPERNSAISGYHIYITEDGQEYDAPYETQEKSLALSGLNDDTLYRWKVEVVQSDGQTTLSEERTFTISEVQYGIPRIALQTPVNCAIDQPRTLTLTWVATPGEQTNIGDRENAIVEYWVYFAKCCDGYGEPERVTEPQIEKRFLCYGVQYHWKVMAVQSDGQRKTSKERSFRTVDREYALPEIALLSPADGATNQATELMLTWVATPGEQTNIGERGASITGYDIYLATDTGNYGTPESTSVTGYHLTGLAYGTTYKWKVEAVQSDGQRAASAERTLTTQTARYATPTIAFTSPLPGATDQDLRVTITWDATPGDQMDVSPRAANFSEFKIFHAEAGEDYPSTPATTAAYTYELTNLASNTEYKYKVQAVQSDGKTGETPEATFMTGNRVVKRYDQHYVFQKSYNILSIALDEANNKDIIEVDGGTELTNETERITIAGTEVTIRSSNETPFTIDMLGLDGVFGITGGASVTMNRLVITGGATEVGGGLYISDTSTLTTRDATITSNTATGNGAGVFVYNATFNANTGTLIAANTAALQGGGASVNIGTINAEGATIASNTATDGGGVSVYMGTLNTEDTTIASNTAAKGGGVYVTEGLFDANTGTFITANNVTEEGGGAYVLLATVNASGVTIASNTASNNGGGVYVFSGTFNANAGVIIASNASVNIFGSGKGGGAWLGTFGTFNASETTIDENTANYGGGVYVDMYGTFNAYAETVIATNTATYSGGGVYVYNAAFNTFGTIIASNTALFFTQGEGIGGGGGVYVCSGTFTATDNTLIASNTANLCGGGVLAESTFFPCTFNANSVTIRGNQATNRQGGGIFLIDIAVAQTFDAPWSGTGPRWNAFSVSDTGVISDSPVVPSDPVQVYDNIAPNDAVTNQMWRP
jgi:hypothetical protein